MHTLYQIQVSYPRYDGKRAPWALNRHLCVYGKRANAVWAIEHCAGDQTLCGRSNTVRAIERCAGDRLMKTGSKKNYNRLHELMIQTKR
jgi:hypothetical protein